MRYYDIKITKKDGSLYIPPSLAAANLPTSYTSFVNGQSIGGALNIELDVPVFNYASPRQGASLTIWGVGIQELAQAADLSFFGVTIKAGMQKGLPLAKPAQNGVILQGTIYQSFGNWVGVDQWLSMTLLPPVGTVTAPVNIQLAWKNDTQLADALQATLSAAYPLYTIKMAISSQLKASGDQVGTYGTLTELAGFIKRYTQNTGQRVGIKPQGGGNYLGVDITIINGTTILVYDGTTDTGQHTASSPLSIAFEDMVGQPTWVSPITINFKTVMRADIQVGDYITLPQGLASPFVLTTAAATTPGQPVRSKSIFQGTFLVISEHHFGNFRQSDDGAWVTSFNAISRAPLASS